MAAEVLLHLLVLLVLLAAAACSGEAYRVAGLGDAGPRDSGSRDVDAGAITEPGAGVFSLTSIEPASGPFSGGNGAVLRGSAFRDDAVVRIGGRSVDPADVTLEGRGRLRIVVPPGEVGPADVSVTQGADEQTLDDAYFYNALALDPVTGSTAGGTSVEITLQGAAFDEDVVIELGGERCAELLPITPQRMRCKTPPHARGLVDVRAYVPGVENRDVLAYAAYEYVSTTDAERGGLSGGPLAGTLNVTVVDSTGNLVIPGAFVMVGNDPSTAHQGLTNARGEITFSGDDLVGRVTVHASKKCFERGSIVSFDAQNATVFLWPIMDLSCADDGELTPGGQGRLAAVVSGELIFPGSLEFGVNAWDVIPPPQAGEARVAYVFTTQATLDARNPAPGLGNTQARLEESSAEAGERGYRYSIVARPAGLAVYAIAGVEHEVTGAFTPYVMGVARNVVTAPGEETADVDIDMSLTLDRRFDVSLLGLPAPEASVPDLYRVRAHLDLGGEGVIVRRIGDHLLDVRERLDASAPLRFFGVPPLVGPLENASYALVAGFYTQGSSEPYTQVQRFGVVPGTSQSVVLDGFLDVPRAVAPSFGDTIPADRVLRFALAEPNPDFIDVSIVGGDGLPAWHQILPGDAREVPLPDLSSVKGQGDIVGGFVTWRVQAIMVDDLEYDAFRYSALTPRFFTHDSVNTFTLRH